MSNKKLGNAFEVRFSKLLSLRSWTVTKIPDGCGRTRFGKLFPVKTPYDFLATKHKGMAFFTDAKTVASDRFAYSAINQDQVNELLKLEQNGFVAGYVIEFRQAGVVGFAKASRLAQVMSGESLKAWETIDLGEQIEIEKLFITNKTTEFFDP